MSGARAGARAQHGMEIAASVYDVRSSRSLTHGGERGPEGGGGGDRSGDWYKREGRRGDGREIGTLERAEGETVTSTRERADGETVTGIRERADGETVTDIRKWAEGETAGRLVHERGPRGETAGRLYKREGRRGRRQGDWYKGEGRGGDGRETGTRERAEGETAGRLYKERKCWNVSRHCTDSTLRTMTR